MGNESSCCDDQQQQQQQESNMWCCNNDCCDDNTQIPQNQNVYQHPQQLNQSVHSQNINAQLAQSQVQQYVLDRSQQAQLQQQQQLGNSQISGLRPNEELQHSQFRSLPIQTPKSVYENQSYMNTPQQQQQNQTLQQLGSSGNLLMLQSLQSAESKSAVRQMQSAQFLQFDQQMLSSGQQQQSNQLQPNVAQQPQQDSQQYLLQLQQQRALDQQQLQHIQQQEIELLKQQQQIQRQQEQQKRFQDDLMVIRKQYWDKLNAELNGLPQHQSLDEPILPQLYQYFNQIPDEKTHHDLTQDPYHGEVYVLANKLNPLYKLCMKVITLSSYKEWEQKERELQLLKLEFTHPHLANIHLLHSKKFLCMCSATFRLCIILDHFNSNLFASSHLKHFSEDDLWMLLDSMIDALYTLHLKGITTTGLRQSRIVTTRLIDETVVYKLIYLKDEQPLLQQLLKQKTSNDNTALILDRNTKEQCYLSPIQWIQLCQSQGQQDSLQNQEKSEVFILGMMILQLTLGPTRHNELFELYEPQQFNDGRLQDYLNLLKGAYSKHLMEILKLMLNVDEYSRLDWIALSQKMNELHSKRVFSQNQAIHHQTIYNLELQKRVESRLALQKSGKIEFQSLYTQKQSKQKQTFQSMIPSHFSEIHQTNRNKHQERTHQPEEAEFVIEQFLLSGTTVENRQRKKVELNDCVYDGDMVNGKRDGLGQAIYFDGMMYDGCWKNDLPNGQGIIYDKSGVEIYNGGFENGEFNGFGVQKNPNPKSFREPYIFQDFTKLGDQWTKYDGDFLHGLFNGFGSLKLTNNEQFVGAFQDGVPHGVGVFHALHLECINGQWDRGQLVKKL